jgi:hypothetical protein
LPQRKRGQGLEAHREFVGQFVMLAAKLREGMVRAANTPTGAAKQGQNRHETEKEYPKTYVRDGHSRPPAPLRRGQRV